MANVSDAVKTVVEGAVGGISGDRASPTWKGSIVAFFLGGLFVLTVAFIVRYVSRKRAEREEQA